MNDDNRNDNRNDNRDALRELCDALLDETINPSQLEMLEQWLANSPAAASWYVNYMGMHASLFAQARSLQVHSKRDSSMTEISFKRSGTPRLLVAAGLAASILIGVIVGYQFGNESTEPSKINNASGLASSSMAPALFMDGHTFSWSKMDRAVAIGDDMPAGWYALEKGRAEVRFSCGARLVMQAPARVRIDSDKACYLASGSVTLFAPDGAEGFTINTPSSQVVDLGTEFGVHVDQHGSTDVHVFNGEVIVKTPKAQDQHLLEGKAARFTENKSQTIAVDETGFAPIRWDTFKRSSPIRLQFDAGHLAGVYRGIQSPAHAQGDLGPYEEFWNQLSGDSSGTFITSDGNAMALPLIIDVGGGWELINWKSTLYQTPYKPNAGRGVLATEMGRDQIEHNSRVGVRIRGLPAGHYRVYVVARSSRKNERRDMLSDVAYDLAIGVNLNDDVVPDMPVNPLSDLTASHWIAGQTHVVKDINIVNPNDYLVIVSKINKQKSLVWERGCIQGVQIIQREKSTN